jgi:OOP family OmpA-OmpF porin
MPRLLRLSSVLACLSWAALAHAQQPGFAVNQFQVSERGSEWFTTDSLDLRGQVRPAIGIVGEWAYRPLVAVDGAGNYQRAIVRNQFVLHPGASLVLFDRLRLAFDVPVQAYADGHSIVIDGTTFAAPSNKTSLGDIRIGVALRLFGVHGDVITGALQAQVELPTGQRASYAGDGDTRVTPSFLIAGDVALFTYAASGGVTIRTSDDSFQRTALGPFASFAASAGLRLCQSRLVIGPEFFAHSVLTHDQFFKRRATPMEGLFGLHWMVVDGLRLGAGIGTGLTSGFGEPDRRGLLSVEWVPVVPPPPPPPDRDGDGILDPDDACPDMPGIGNTDPSQNGCPPPAPADRDHDGILDRDDACPDEPGEPNGDPTKNGCPPPPDRDRDGILDADDACPDEPGEANADPTKNGCPPPPDRDRDGILDADDACPDEPGKPHPDPQRNGCPKAFVRGDQIKILDQVKFRTGSAEILPGQDSEEVLQAVYQILVDHPEITTVRIEGHTDSRGGAKMNRRLSRDRAQSVVMYLVKHGIDSARLASQGFGLERPIDTNATEQGRRNNRRVEFHIESNAARQP